MTNRETWLTDLVTQLRPRLEGAGYPVPDELRISCGWPSRGALAKYRRRVGECWPAEASADGVHQVFVSPVLADSMAVAETVVHELGHAVLPSGTKHGKPFRAFMKAVGLQGKPTVTEAGPELTKMLEGFLASLGAYPNAKLDKTAGPAKKQTTRMRKVACSREHEDYILRGSKNTLEMGLPNCPICGNGMEVVETEEDK